MHPQSSSYHRLVDLYRRLIQRMRAYERAARHALFQDIFMRVQVETLQPRLMLSGSPSTTETLVSGTSSNIMQTPAIACDPAGDTVIVWATPANNGAVYGERYNSSGVSQGTIFQIDENTASQTSAPSVAMANNGSFAVVWNGGTSDVFARLFNANGSAITDDILVATTRTGSSASRIAMGGDGSFTVVWEGNDTPDTDGIYARQFLPSGIAKAAPFLVNTANSNSHYNPAIAENASGSVVIAWTNAPASGDAQVEAELFPAGASASGVFAAGAESGYGEDNAAVGMDASGNFVIAWDTNYLGSEKTDVNATRFNASGTALNATPTLVNTTTLNDQEYPAVAVRFDGAYVITWTSTGQDAVGSGTGVYGQLFTSAGATNGSEFLVNVTTAGNQQDSAVAWSQDTAIPVWDGNGSGSANGVFAGSIADAGPVNQSPTITTPASQTIVENTPITFSVAKSDSITVADADAYGAQEQVSITSTNGTFSLPTTSGLTFALGGGGGSVNAMTFTGTISNINAALNGLVFTPTSSFTGSATISLNVNDQGSSGSGGPRSATGNVLITVQSPPTSDTFPSSQSTVENTALTFSPPTSNAIYVGSTMTAVELDATDGTLTLSGTNGLTFGTDTNTTIQFAGTTAAMNAALNGLVFTPNNNYTGSAASLKIVTSTGGLLGLGILSETTTDTVGITVTATPAAVNQPPEIDIPGNQSVGENSSLNFNLSNNYIDVSDPDSGSASILLSLTATGGTLTLANKSGITLTSGTGTNDVSMTLSGSYASIDSVLADGITFTPALNYHGSGGIYLYANDQGHTGTGGAKTTSATIPIAVSAVNQAPTLTVPTGTTYAIVNSSLTTAANAIVMADIDGGQNIEQLQLTASSGTLTLATTSGVTIYSGANNSSTITIRGTLGALNAAVNGLIVTPAANFTGTDTVTLVANDLGNTGAGGAKMATASFAVKTLSSIVVTTDTDVVDGNVASINALLNNEGADNAISLREAIEAIDASTNNASGPIKITFDIPGSGVQTIMVSSPLPDITQSTIIDATTQTGYSSKPLVQLDGTNLTDSSTAIGLGIEASNCTIRGLSIINFLGNGIDVLPVGANNESIQANYIGINSNGVAMFNGVGIVLANSANDVVGGTSSANRNLLSGNYYQGIEVYGASSTNDIIAGNYIGTNPAGTAAVGNGQSGIFVDGAANVTIGSATSGGGNLISGNGYWGIDVGGTSPTAITIIGNTIGLNAAGTASLSNGYDGVYLDAATNCTIGGTASGDRNVISGNNNSSVLADGIYILDGSNNIVEGNYLGLNAAGTASVLNYNDGIDIQASTGNTIGGTATGAGNVISGNGGYGIAVNGPNADGNIIEGNYIGTNAAGNAAVTNGNDGIYLNDVSNTIVGGSSSPARNVISGNTSDSQTADGVYIFMGSANQVQGNYIGVTASGTGALGNDNAGVEIEASTGNIIGGIAAGQGNLIAYNSRGVVTDQSATTNAIRGNYISENTVIGIDLGDDGITANTGTTDPSLANYGMNYPVITDAAWVGSTLTLTGYVGTPSTEASFAGALVDVYISDQTLTNGQGSVYLGTITVGSNGIFQGSMSAGSLTEGSQITSTATDSLGNTSEFGPNATPLPPNQPPVITLPQSIPTAWENSSYSFNGSDDGPNSLFSVSDVDADGGVEQLGLTVTNGVLDFSPYGNITIVAGSNNTSSVTIQGTLHAINNAIASMSYIPSTNFYGSATLSLLANDLGNTGAGGPQTASGSLNLTVNPVAHTPSVSNATATVNKPNTSGLVITPSSMDGSANGYYQITNIVNGTLATQGGAPLTNGQFINFAQGAAGLVFTPSTNSIAQGSITVQASSLPNTVGLVGTTVSATIAVRGPLETTPGPQTIAEDTPIVFSSANGNAISVNDNLTSGLTTSVTATNGVLNLGTTTGLTFTAGANGSASMVFQGTLSAINAALNGLTFTPAVHYYGSVGIGVATIDGYGSASNGIPVTVTRVAHTPSVTNSSTLQGYQTTSGLVISPSSLDSGMNLWFQISGITGGTLYLNDGVTALTNGQFITASQGAAGLKFTPSSSTAGSFNVQVSTTATTSGLTGSVVPASISVHAQPIVVLNSSALTYDEGQGIVAVDPNLSLVSPSSTTLTGATVSISGFVAGQDTLSATEVPGISVEYRSTTGQLILSGTASVSAYQSVLQSVTFANSSQYVPGGTRGIVYTINDGAEASQPATQQVNIVEINVAPTIVAPGAQTIPENQAITFASAQSDAITFGDVDSQGGTEQVTLSVAEGTLTLGSSSGVTASPGATAGSITLTGTISALNAAVAGLTYTPNAQYSGSDALNIAINDQGNSGQGGPMTATASVPLTIVQVANQPTVTNAVTSVNTQTTSGLVITPSSLDSGVTDYFQISQIVGGSLYLSDGTTPVSNGEYITQAQGLAGLTFTPSTNSVASGSFVVNASTTMSAVGMSSQSAQATITVNAAPVLVADQPLVVPTSSQAPITAQQLDTTEIGTSSTQLVYTLTSVPQYGQVLVQNTPIPVGGQFTQRQIQEGAVTYSSGSVAGAADSFTFTVADTTGHTLPAATFNVQTSAAAPVTPVLPPATPPSAGGTQSTTPQGTAQTTVVPGASTTTQGGTTTPSGSETHATAGTTTPASSPAGNPIAPPQSNSSLGDNSAPAVARAISSTVSSSVGTVVASHASNDDTRRISAGASRPLSTQLNLGDTTIDTVSSSMRITAGDVLATLSQQHIVLAGGNGHGGGYAISNLSQTFANSSPIWRDLDAMQNHIESDRKIHVVAGAASLVSVGVSVIYVVWALRAGSILSSLLSSMPAWKLVDPLPILDQMAGGMGGDDDDEEDDDETLESMVNRKTKTA